MKNISVHTKISAEVEHCQGTKHFLENKLDGYTVEVQEINGILQVTIGIFNTPTKMIKLFQFSGWEFITRQIGYKAFI